MSVERLEDELGKLDREDLERLVKSLLSNGVALSFHGKRTVMEIAKKVRPRVMRREPKLHVGAPHDQARNLIVEGENLQAMVTLYKYRGEVDLIVTDPPYNTGQHFRYNDRWDTDPNDPELGTIVSKEDGSRHTKWIKAMMPRLQMMKAMLKPSGVIAICIDDNELYHLGMMMDEVFGEENRLGILNWQKTYAPKKANHVASATEYVLVYAKTADLATTRHQERTETMNNRFTNPDMDPLGVWRQGDFAAKESRDRTIYAVQSPFTGNLHYPEGEHVFGSPVSVPTRHWSGFTKDEVKTLLEAWGSEYVIKDIGDGRGKAIVLKDSDVSLSSYDPSTDLAVQEARNRALTIHAAGLKHEKPWPRLVFSDDRQRNTGAGRPTIKRHLEHISQGKIPWTFWADENYETPIEIGATSWPHQEAGHSQAGINELDGVVGKGHGFETVKPLKLITKIIQIWCPPNGLVMDPYAGSGTTGHAVLQLNEDTGADRRFVLIEQGAPENGDKYARTLTWQRLHNAITGERPNGREAPALGGGFEYRLLTKTIDAKAVMAMQRDELIDVVLTSHWETHRRAAPNLVRYPDEQYQYLIGTDAAGEGYFLLWDPAGSVGSLSLESYRNVVAEAKKAGLPTPYHIYARYELFQSPNVRFWKIPDKILSHLGLDENDQFNNPEEAA
jgi:adenine-specific DNA-methyltransferase